MVILTAIQVLDLPGLSDFGGLCVIAFAACAAGLVIGGFGMWLLGHRNRDFPRAGTANPREAAGITAQQVTGEIAHSAFFNNPAAILVTRLEDGVVLEVNGRWLEMAGETRENVFHRSVRNMWPSLDEFQHFIAKLKETGHVHGWEQAFRNSTGKVFITQISSQILTMRGETVVISTLVDITERKHMEDTLRQSEERFRELAETVGDVFWVTDPENHRMIYISPGYERIWGRTRQSLYDAPRTWLDAVHPDDRERVQHAADTERATGGYVVEYRIVRPDGQTRWICDQAFPVLKDGEVKRVVGVARDITEFHLLEEQLRQSQKMDAIGQLASGVAHDFNNILSAIIMQADVVSRSEGMSGQIREMVDDIKAGCFRAADLTRQLLAFGRRQIIQPRLLDLNDVVLQMTRKLQRVIPANVDMRMDLHSLPVMAVADPGSLDQVLLNLVVNARDAMAKGGLLTISTSQTELDTPQAAAIANVQPGQYVCLTVTDTGCGIPAEILPRIFEPFFTTKEVGKGVGLGLATVFGIVKQHGGAVLVDSIPGQGTTFRVLLPSAPDAAPITEDVPASSPSGGNETILLVEDDESVLKIASLVLEHAGYHVIPASHGDEALELWTKHADEIRLLLTDMVMPQGPVGHKLAAILQERAPGLKVILTSGYSPDITNRQTSLIEGRNFLQKPYQAESLLKAVRRSLDG